VSNSLASLHYTIITLKHDPSGTTTLSWNPENEELTVNIKLTGLAPNSPHAAHIHAGNCNIDGSVVYPLNPIVADAKGEVVSETTIEHVKNGIPASGWYINVHNGVNMATSIDKTPISCGNISNPNASTKSVQSVQVTMQGTIAPNEAANGKAEVIAENGKPALKITLTGLQPGSTHVSHIHAGSCAAQGPVVTMLNPVFADAKGNGTSITTLSQVPYSPNGLYVNVHAGATMAELGQSTLFNPIACGNLALN